MAQIPVGAEPAGVVIPAFGRLSFLVVHLDVVEVPECLSEELTVVGHLEGLEVGPLDDREAGEVYPADDLHRLVVKLYVVEVAVLSFGPAEVDVELGQW